MPPPLKATKLRNWFDKLASGPRGRLEDVEFFDVVMLSRSDVVSDIANDVLSAATHASI